MKTKINVTVDVSDEQREQIGAVIDGPGAKKRQATRDECRDFIWSHGTGWESVLSRADGFSAEQDRLDDAVRSSGLLEANGVDTDQPELDGMDLI